MNEAQAMGLRTIEPPGSLLKVLRFLEDFRRWEGGDLGIAFASARFAAGIAERHLGTRPIGRQPLMARYGLSALDVQAFVFWVRKAAEPETAHPARSSRFAPIRTLEETSSVPVRRRAAPIRRSIEEREVLEPSPEENRSLRLRRRRVERARRPERGEARLEGESSIGTVVAAGAVGLSGLAFGAYIASKWSRSDDAPPRFALAERPGRLPLRSRPPSVEIDRVPIEEASDEAGTVSLRRRTAPSRREPAVQDPLAEAVVRHRMAGFPRVPTRDLLAGTPDRKNPLARAPIVRKPSALPFNPLLGQVTLVAPPVRVAAPGGKGKPSAMAFDLPSLKKGMGQLSPDSLSALKEILPAGAQALYPAVPLDMAGPSAVNVPLAPETIALLMKEGYGRAEAGWAESVASLAFSTPPVTALAGKLLPTPPSPEEPDSISPPGRKQRVGGRMVDFLGLPIHLAPRPDSPHDLPHRQVVRQDLRSTPTLTIRPNVFMAAQRKTFPHFHTVTIAPTTGGSRPVAISSLPAASRVAIPGPALGFAISPGSAGSSGEPSPTSIPVRPPSLPASAPIGARAAPTTSALGIGSRPAGPSLGGTPFTPLRPSVPEVPPPSAPTPYAAPDLSPPPRPTLDLPIPSPSREPLPSAPVSMTSTSRLALESRSSAATPSASSLLTAVRSPMSPSPASRPAMPLAERRAARPEEDDVVVQKSKGEAATPAAKAMGSKSAGAAAGGGATKDAEIGLLANEVWSLLKRRLAFEAQRAGQR